MNSTEFLLTVLPMNQTLRLQKYRMLSLAEGALDLNAQKLLSVLWEFYRDQYGEYTYCCMGVKGYKNEVWDAAVTIV